jgi:hypothetical protein
MGVGAQEPQFGRQDVKCVPKKTIHDIVLAWRLGTLNRKSVYVNDVAPSTSPKTPLSSKSISRLINKLIDLFINIMTPDISVYLVSATDILLIKSVCKFYVQTGIYVFI